MQCNYRNCDFSKLEIGHSYKMIYTQKLEKSQGERETGGTGRSLHGSKRKQKNPKPYIQ